MFSNIFVGVSDFDRSLLFYPHLMDAIGVEIRLCDASRPRAGWQSSPDPRPLFVIAHPFNKEHHQPGNGQMVSFLSKDRTTVRLAYETAMANGGVSEGAPGLRPEYHEHYY